MIDGEVFGRLEAMIRWGRADEAQQASFERCLAGSPELATGSDGSGATLLKVAADAANFEAARRLVAAGASPGACSETGDTPLVSVVRGAPDRGGFDAEENARLAIGHLLIEAGGNVNALTTSGCSALHLAVIHARVALVGLFLRGGGDGRVRLDDPPSHENALELVASRRFRGSAAQRAEIARLLAAAP